MSERRTLSFTKMEGAGNDYVYIDFLAPVNPPTKTDAEDSTSKTDAEVSPSETETEVCTSVVDEIDLPELARKISDRHFGVGGDGLIAILPSANADFRMRMFNADGSEAQMCGNGSRCVGKYVYDKGFTDKKVITLETLAGIKVLDLHVENGKVKSVTVDMGEAHLKRDEIPAAGEAHSRMIAEKVKVEDKEFPITAVGMGNPHGVIFVDEITDNLVHHYGSLLEVHEIWPERANIEFAKVISPEKIQMRVWERGSGETLACGTGACATLVAAVMNGLCGDEADVEVLGGTLHIKYDKKSGHVFMTGPAVTVAEGVYYY